MNDRLENQVVTLANLQVENMETPLGIDTPCPHFSWQMLVTTEARGYEQSAYQIIVKDEKGMIVWDTKKVESGRSIGIQYQGAELKATEKYTWTVMIWDQDGNAVKIEISSRFNYY